MDFEQQPNSAQPPEAASAGVFVSHDEAAMNDPAERWLVTKGGFDYGPFRYADVITQISSGDIAPNHQILDNETGDRFFAEEHPHFGPMVEQAREVIDERRRAQAAVDHAKRSRRRGTMLFATIGAGVVALGAVAYVIVGQAKEKGDSTADAPEIAAMGTGTLEAKIRFPSKPQAMAAPKRAGGRAAGAGGSDTLALDMSAGGGSERLSGDQINAGVQSAGGKLSRCLVQNGGGSANIAFIVEGPTGRVNWVKVNGQQTGGLYTCINRVMRSVSFPTVDGPRTRAEFNMEI